MFVVKLFFLSQHGTNCRTVLLLVGEKYSIFVCFWVCYVCDLSVHSPSDHSFQQRRKTKKTNKKKKEENKTECQPCTYYVCVSQEMLSVKHFTLEAWAHLKECVPVSFPFFLLCSLISKLTFQDSNVKSFGFHHGTRH